MFIQSTLLRYHFNEEQSHNFARIMQIIPQSQRFIEMCEILGQYKLIPNANKLMSLLIQSDFHRGYHHKITSLHEQGILNLNLMDLEDILKLEPNHLPMIMVIHKIGLLNKQTFDAMMENEFAIALSYEYLEDYEQKFETILEILDEHSLCNEAVVLKILDIMANSHWDIKKATDTLWLLNQLGLLNSQLRLSIFDVWLNQPSFHHSFLSIAEHRMDLFLTQGRENFLTLFMLYHQNANMIDTLAQLHQEGVFNRYLVQSLISTVFPQELPQLLTEGGLMRIENNSIHHYTPRGTFFSSPNTATSAEEEKKYQTHFTV